VAASITDTVPFSRLVTYANGAATAWTPDSATATRTPAIQKVDFKNPSRQELNLVADFAVIVVLL
jgi:hypothetical protein